MSNAIVINKNSSKIVPVLEVAFFPLKFISLSNDSIITSHVIAKSSIILAKYFPFLQLHVEMQLSRPEIYLDHKFR